jgi:hypothetical protein
MDLLPLATHPLHRRSRAKLLTLLFAPVSTSWPVSARIAPFMISSKVRSPTLLSFQPVRLRRIRRPQDPFDPPSAYSENRASSVTSSLPSRSLARDQYLSNHSTQQSRNPIEANNAVTKAIWQRSQIQKYSYGEEEKEGD